MGEFILSCCSTSDLSVEHYKKRSIETCLFHYNLGGKDYPDDFGQTIPLDEFYRRMEEGEMTKTSQVNTDEYLEFFRPFLESGKDILHFTLSSGLSGAINSANIARQMLEEEFPDRKIIIVDSLAASSGYGLLMDYIADYRDAGHNIEETKAYAEEIRLSINHWFYSTDLKYYVRGGRVSKASGFVGTMLHICPLLNVNNTGHLIPRQKVMTRKRVQLEIVNKMVANAKDGLNYNGKCYISHSACIEDANKVKEMLEERFVNLKGKIEIYPIGTTIGSHTGPGTLALFFMGNERGE